MRSMFFYRDFEEYDEKAAKKHLKEGTLEPLAVFRQKLEALPEWEQEPIHEALKSTAEERQLNLGKLAQPVRIAVSGGPVSPPIDVTLLLLGREKTLARIDCLLEYLKARFARLDRASAQDIPPLLIGNRRSKHIEDFLSASLPYT